MQALRSRCYARVVKWREFRYEPETYIGWWITATPKIIFGGLAPPASELGPVRPLLPAPRGLRFRPLPRKRLTVPDAAPRMFSFGSGDRHVWVHVYEVIFVNEYLVYYLDPFPKPMCGEKVKINEVPQGTLDTFAHSLFGPKVVYSYSYNDDAVVAAFRARSRRKAFSITAQMLREFAAHYNVPENHVYDRSMTVSAR